MTAIEIDRLILRSPQISDLDTLTEISNDPEVTRFLPSQGVAIARNKVEKSLQSFIEHWQQRGYGIWVIVEAASSETIGYCGLRYLDELQEVELLYGLARAYWGRNIMTKAATAAVSWGFEIAKLERIVAMVLPDNNASKRVIEKLDFGYEKQIEIFDLNVLYYSLTSNAVRKKESN